MVLDDDGEIQNNLDQIGKMINYKIIEENYDQVEFRVKILLVIIIVNCLLVSLFLVYHQNKYGSSS